MRFVVFNTRNTHFGFILGPGMSFIQSFDRDYGYRINVRTSDKELRSFYYAYIESIHDTIEEMMQTVENNNKIAEVMNDTKLGFMNCEYQYLPDDDGNVDVCGSRSYIMDVSGTFLCESHWTLGSF